MDADLLKLAERIASNLDGAWTFLLLMTRYLGLIMLLPGVGAGERGIVVRGPAIMLLAATSMCASPIAKAPADWGLLIGQLGSEMVLGLMLGAVPYMIMAGVQMAGQMMTTSMGLGAGNMIDPNLGTPSTDIAILLGNLATILFLLTDGHHAVIHAAAGFGGEIVPGTFAISEQSIGVFIDRSAAIFRMGLMISVPLLIALLLTNFVMGIISKAVPTVNIFIVSFPLTVGIGLVLTALALPDMVQYLGRELGGVDGTLLAITEEVRTLH